MTDEYEHVTEPYDNLGEIAKLVTSNVVEVMARVKQGLEKGGHAALLAQGMIFELTKHSDWAVRSYKEAFAQQPSDLEPLARLVVAEIHAQRFGDALSSAIKLTSRNPKFQMKSLCQGEIYSSYTLLGEALVANGRFPEAGNAYELALTFDPKDGFSAGRLAQLKLAEGEHDAASKLAKRTGDSPRFRQLRAMGRLAETRSNLLPPFAASEVQRLAMSTGSAAGRPLTADGRELHAAAVRGHGWLEQVVGVETRDDDRVSASWLETAKAEHSSVGSFARLILELMHFGAPAYLLEKAGRALLDEVHHAKSAYQISSELSGEPLGAGPMDVSGVLCRKPTLEVAVREAIAEGCIGETIAAVIAGAAASRSLEPRIREALATVSSDEMRHAELAWHFLEWALSKDAALVSHVEHLAEGSLAEEISATIEAWAAPAGGAAPGFGLMPAGEISERITAAFEQLIRPRARALVAAARAGSLQCATSVREELAAADRYGLEELPAAARLIH